MIYKFVMLLTNCLSNSYLVGWGPIAPRTRTIRAGKLNLRKKGE